MNGGDAVHKGKCHEHRFGAEPTMDCGLPDSRMAQRRCFDRSPHHSLDQDRDVATHARGIELTPKSVHAPVEVGLSQLIGVLPL